MNNKNKFSIGDEVKIISENSWDSKRFPGYIAGKTGIILDIRGQINNPMDHPERTSFYSVMFTLNQISSRSSNNEKIIADVFEDWILDKYWRDEVV